MNFQNKNVLVLGGGVGGVIFAITLAYYYPKLSITIIEKDKTLAKRILVSGNGRCNFFNRNLLENNFFEFQNKKVISSILEKDFSIRFLSFITRYCNFSLYTDSENRMYPFSNKSETIHKCLLNSLNKLNINLVNDCVESINIENKTVKTLQGQYNYDFLHVSLGGMSYLYSKFNYNLFEDLKIKYKKFQPSLCPIKIKKANFTKFSGTRFFSKVTLFEDHKQIFEEDGEVLIKNDGFSGIVIFNLSSYIEEGKKYTIKLTINEHHGIRLNLTKDNYRNELPIKLCDFIDTMISEAKKLKDYNSLYFEIDKAYDFKESQVSKYGADIENIDLKTMTIKDKKNISLSGEILDITCPCGGYNLGLTMIEAYKAAISLVNILKKES